ncbi:MAG: zincin-like metallopeptidase domain-containing protein [Erythrobacter sp.]
MARTSTRRKPGGKPRRDIATEITNLILAKLEQGVMPWVRPWNTSGGGRPLRHCGTAYTGINTLFLWAMGDAMGYSSRYWMTYRQAAEMGGQVRKGETSSLSVYYSQIKKTEQDRMTGEEQTRAIRFLKAYNVFNADQIDGLPAHYYPVLRPHEDRKESEHRTEIDAFFSTLPIDVRYGGNAAFFSPAGDYIQMPPREAFRSDDHFASTLAHESIHWSGGKTRLERTFGKRFGDRAYAFEELVASIGQCLVCADLGLPGELHDNHASYIANWLDILKGDATAIIHAAAKAEQAFGFLKAFGSKKETSEKGEPKPHSTCESNEAPALKRAA